MGSAEQFNSPTYGQLTAAAVVGRIIDVVKNHNDGSHRLIVGTDSLPSSNGQVWLVTAVVLHHVGHGGIYFWRRQLTPPMYTLRDRMYAEALASITLAQKLEAEPRLKPYLKDNIEIHVDVGKYGPTRDMIQELVGMIVAHGYLAKTKPESFAASKVADRHTIPGPRLVLAPVLAD